MDHDIYIYKQRNTCIHDRIHSVKSIFRSSRKNRQNKSRNVMTQSILRFKKNSILGSQHGVRFGKSGSLILRIRISRDDGAQGSG